VNKEKDIKQNFEIRIFKIEGIGSILFLKNGLKKIWQKKL
jgi:hypothetical protein